LNYCASHAHDLCDATDEQKQKWMDAGGAEEWKKKLGRERKQRGRQDPAKK
jgi:hypothetical protein